MISFVWEPGIELPAGTGGSENYTTGQVRELNRRGIAARVVTVGCPTADGRDGFPGVPFWALDDIESVGRLDGTVIFVTDFPAVRTRSRSLQMLHVPPPLGSAARARTRAQLRDRSLIATSGFAAQLWSEFLDVDPEAIAIVHPFAEPCFGLEERAHGDPSFVRILFAGRLSPEKGVYTLLAALHDEQLVGDPRLVFTATDAGHDKPQGAIIRVLLQAHPGIRLVESCRSPAAMAALLRSQDIVVIPSNSQYWHETFGIISVEAQHAGCRVVASDDGGLPETDCGGLTLVLPDDAHALAQGIQEAVLLGALPVGARGRAATRFTVGDSVDELMKVLSKPLSPTPAQVVDDLEQILAL